VGIVQRVAHETGESILCREGSDALFPNDFGGRLVIVSTRVIWIAAEFFAQPSGNFLEISN